MVKKIGTHSGAFHCDEAMAIAMLQKLPEYKDATIIRSRDPKQLEVCDIVVDVGGEYCLETNRFDHHQRTFTTTFSDSYTTKLSSAGLVYKHFGKKIITLKLDKDEAEEAVELFFQKMYQDLIHALDAIDNGVSNYATKLKPLYVESTNLPSQVENLLPYWNQPCDSDTLAKQFTKAVKLTGSYFDQKLNYLTEAWLPCRQLVVEAYQNRLQVDPSGRILVLEKSCPWDDHVFTYEEDNSIPDQHKAYFVVYPDESNSFMVQCIPVYLNSFTTRLPLYKEWCGIRDTKLAEVSGIQGTIFVHASGFIGGNKSLDGAIQMAQLSLQFHEKEQGSDRLKVKVDK